MFPRTFPIGRAVFVGLLVFVALSGRPAQAGAGDLYADLDRDGVRDVISIEPAPSRGLLVWLSASRTVFRLPTRRPIARVLAADIDGDGRVELVASDTSARLHVWHRTTRGHLRRTPPRRGPPSAGPARHGTLAEACERDAAADITTSSTSSPFDAPHPEQLSSHSRDAVWSRRADAAATSVSTGPLQPRAPPTNA